MATHQKTEEENMFKKIGEFLDKEENMSAFLILCGIASGALAVALAVQLDIFTIIRDMEDALRDYYMQSAYFAFKD